MSEGKAFGDFGNECHTDPCEAAALVGPIAPSATIKLSLIKFKPFTGDIDMDVLL